jgi:rSAM/selenodomain-associated transferase 2
VTSELRLSAVIPTWQERLWIEDAVRSAAAWADEVVVADAISPDGTGELARRAGARVLTTQKGRGAQLDAGARAAIGDVLVFLHADARLDPQARVAIARALADPLTTGGNFKLRFAPRSSWADFFGWANDVRRRLLGIYYGDSAMFLRKSSYLALGGFRQQPILEDYDLARRLERHGRTHYVTDVEVVVSARRFAERPLRTLACWALIQTAYSAGVSPARLARLYADVR